MGQRNEQYAYSSTRTSSVSWLHLSDIHFLQGTQQTQVYQEMILRALVKEIGKDTSNSNSGIPRPDAVFVTGDIAFSGLNTEYICAEKWLNEVAEAFNLNASKIFVVPGNHDVQRSIFWNDDDVEILIELLRENKRELEWAFSKKQQCLKLKKRLENYLNFASKFAPRCLKISKEKEQLFWQYTFSTATGYNIQLLGLNTALLAQDDNDKGKLQLSLNQLKDFPDLDNRSNQIAIGLTHHPLSWLHNNHTIEGWLRKKIHIHLCGHIHDADSILDRPGGGTNLIRIQAGAVHENDRTYATSSFNYATIVINSLSQILVRVWNRKWSEKHKDFRDDPDFHPTNTPYAEYPLAIQHTSSRALVKKEGRPKKQMDWPTYHKAISLLKDEIDEKPELGGFRPHLVIGVNQGGALIGGFLYYFLNRNFGFVNIWTNFNDWKVRSENLQARELLEIVNGMSQIITEPLRILLVDDSLKTGISMSRAIALVRSSLIEIEQKKVSIKIAVIVYRSDLHSETKENPRPDYFIYEDYTHFPYAKV